MTNYTIEEVPNPAYQKAMKDRKSFTPVKESIRASSLPMQPSLAEQMATREKRYDIKLLGLIKDICDHCTDCSDCGIAMEMRSIDLCDRVKRNMIYMGVVEP